MDIVFNNFPKQSLSREQLSAWLHSCIRANGYIAGKIMFIFVDKDEMYALNNQFLNHQTHTDIITFDYSDSGLISAEIYISEPQMRENAVEQGQSTEKEMLRLLCHGILHCMGYTDKTDEEKTLMRTKENEWMDLFHVKQ